MYKSMMPDFLSVEADLPRSVEVASRYGFAGVDTSAQHLLAPNLDIARLQDQMGALEVRPGYVSLPPGRLPVSEADWQAAVAMLPEIARRAQRLGFTRAGLVVLPFHEAMPFAEAFEQMVRRLNAIMDILDPHGIALALEYVSPLSRRAPYPCAFLYDMKGMLTLCDAVDSKSVGLMLDTFHWHCAEETVADIKALKPEKVVVVHVNDALSIPVTEQVVSDRALPGATGVIDIAGFLGALAVIGYNGPVTCEPMAKAISALPDHGDDAVLSQVSAAMNRFLPSV